jgi:hypothetical protein
MKTTLILQIAVPCALVAGALAQAPPVLPGGSYPATAAEVGMLPDQKRAEADASRLQEGVRNPFATRTDKSPSGPVAKDTQSEEARIRAALDKFTVNGFAQSPDGSLTAQLESIILKEGELLPRVIEGQVDDLRVTKITAKLVEFTWVGDEDADNARQVTKAVDMSPKVAVMLPAPTGAKGQLTTMKSGLPPELEP